ncbi:MAG: helix-turn-helix transcriptional regulator [Leptospira sp.]|nr:helix-turn-helix transcriptional regulator [Leptospira sp.]
MDTKDTFTTDTTKSSVDEQLALVLAEKLRSRRLELGFSMEKLAKLSSVSRGMLGLIESGKSMPSIGILWKLSKALRTPIGEMIPDLFSQMPKYISKNEGKTWNSLDFSQSSRLIQTDEKDRVVLIEWIVKDGTLNHFGNIIALADFKIVQTLGKSKIILRSKEFILEEGDILSLPKQELISIEKLGSGDSKLLGIGYRSLKS